MDQLSWGIEDKKCLALCCLFIYEISFFLFQGVLTLGCVKKGCHCPGLLMMEGCESGQRSFRMIFVFKPSLLTIFNLYDVFLSLLANILVFNWLILWQGEEYHLSASFKPQQSPCYSEKWQPVYTNWLVECSEYLNGIDWGVHNCLEHFQIWFEEVSNGLETLRLNKWVSKGRNKL